MNRKEPETPHDEWDQTGLCEEAQADGVPCFELGRQCETCSRARTDAVTPKTEKRSKKQPRKKP